MYSALSLSKIRIVNLIILPLILILFSLPASADAAHNKRTNSTFRADKSEPTKVIVIKVKRKKTDNQPKIKDLSIDDLSFQGTTDELKASIRDQKVSISNDAKEMMREAITLEINKRLLAFVEAKAESDRAIGYKNRVTRYQGKDITLQDTVNELRARVSEQKVSISDNAKEIITSVIVLEIKKRLLIKEIGSDKKSYRKTFRLRLKPKR